ncbi:MAG: NADH-quinone oxidoreductase subunit [Actinomycetota bacterium]|nr:NADH-quinone oxidoreductase subunit [Actinomycetota bacterium]
MTVKIHKGDSNGAPEPVLAGETREVAEAIAAKYPNSRSAVLPLLFLVQSVEGYVTEQGMREVAELLDLTPAQILASGSFYTMLKKKPQGEYLVSVCRNISCTHNGARKVIAALEERLGIEAGGTTADGKFSLEAAECLATCDGAPSMQINYEDFYKVAPDKAVELVDALAKGTQVRSTRDEVVKTSKEISREVACAGLRWAEAGVEDARTIGGESPMPDTKPGFRPKVPGKEGD